MRAAPLTTAVLGILVVATAPVGAASPAATTPHQRAVAYDESLLDRAPTLPTETALATAPTGMQKPTQFVGSTALVIRTHYWQSSQSVRAVYRALKTSDAAGLRVGGHGTVPVGSAHPRRAQVDFYPHRPATIAAADLFVEVRRHGSGSVIGAFAEAVAYPDKPATELVPHSVRRATLSRSTKAPQKKVQTSPPYHLSVPQARWLAAAFDRMPAEPPLASGCPGPIGTEIRYQISFHAAGHEWLVKTPFFCGIISVTRDGRHLKDLQSTGQFDLRLRRTWRAVGSTAH